MLPLGCIFFKGSPFEVIFVMTGKLTVPFYSSFKDTDTNILWMSVYELILCN